MKKIKIVFNCRGSNTIGSVRIPFCGIKDCFDSYEEFDVAREVYDAYQQFDVAILHGDEDEIIEARKQNPNIIIGIAKPHHERVVHPPFYGFGLKSFLYQFRFIFGDGKSRFIRNRNAKLQSADFLIADTLYLKGLFESAGFNSIYLKLIEPFWEEVKPTEKEESWR
ncbi:MAG: hypothetical protein NVV73_20895 [Cellvibrionaceae bacterium]|nr:hypothetical protein [Cellvibrionaceae bacterium]